MNEWQPTGVIPAELSDSAVDAITRIYVARLVGTDADDVVLGEHERSALLVAQAEVACCQEAGEWPHLWFSGPPLRIEVGPIPPR